MRLEAKNTYNQLLQITQTKPILRALLDPLLWNSALVLAAKQVSERLGRGEEEMEKGRGWNILITEHEGQVLSLTTGQPWKRAIEVLHGASMNQ